MFIELGADWTFLEAPQSIDEMKRYCKEVPGAKLANMLEFGKTPILPPAQLQEIGIHYHYYHYYIHCNITIIIIIIIIIIIFIVILLLSLLSLLSLRLHCCSIPINTTISSNSSNATSINKN